MQLMRRTEENANAGTMLVRRDVMKYNPRQSAIRSEAH